MIVAYHWKKHKKLFLGILLISVIILASFLRLYKLNQIPASLTPDELALGYNSYSILKTGTDEHGKFLPLSLQSFGDWKLPGYPIANIIPVALFGLNETAVRLPSALAGIADVLLVYFIAEELFKRNRISILAALFISISPWSIYFSRIAYEVNLATTFFLLSFLLFLRHVHKKSGGKSLQVAAVSFGLSMWTYHAYILFTPLFLLGFGVLYLRSFQKKISEVFALGIFGSFTILSFWATLTGGIGKASHVNVFNDPYLVYSRMGLRADVAVENSIIKHLLYNKLTAGIYQTGQNYLLSFSPSFLFDKGSTKVINGLGFFGNFYLFDALLLFAGTASLLWRREKETKLLFLWLILAPIPSAITNDVPNGTRLFLLLPAFILVAAYGADAMLSFFSNRRLIYKLACLALALLFFFNIIYFFEGYFLHVNIQRAEFLHYGYEEAVDITNKYPNLSVVMRGPQNFPYISFLFYNHYDPRRFQREVVYYPTTSEGFLLVKQFGRFRFVDAIDYKNLKPKTIYIDLDSPVHISAKTITLPSGKPVFWYFVKN